ncbi:MAG: hypothetical protein KBG72_00300 [Agrobacterium sp.]|nr:hypothetical protein [Agrobacterium sp.]
MNDLSKNRSGSKPEGRRLPSYFDLIQDELRRRGGGGGGGGGGTRRSPKGPNLQSGAVQSGAATAFSRASGNNAVVVKVLSFGAGAGAARNVLAYQSKEERAHDQDGREIADINQAVREWEREFANRKGSKDVVRFSYELENTDRESVARALDSLASEGFRHTGDTDRTYAFSVSAGVNGQTRLQLALVIAHEKSRRGESRSDNRIPAELDDIHAIDARLDGALRREGITPISRYPVEFTSGPKGLTATLHAMQRDGVEITLSTKSHIRERDGKSGVYERSDTRREVTTKDHKEITAEGRTVAALMQTRQPRDFMHLLLSGPANVDRDQFILAGRDFLKEQFAGHRYAYAVHNRHDMEKHPHLHVIVSLRGPTGKAMHPNIRDFTEWRLRFADKARERGIAIDRQKRIERAGPPPVKRWEWEMFRRMGATAPTNVIEKVMSKVRDKPTAPKLEIAREKFDQTKRSINRVIDMLETLAKDKTAPSTARELSQDLSVGLRREYNRLEAAIREGRDPAQEKGQDHMLRSTPISAGQAKAAKETLAQTAISVASKIANPTDRLIFEQASKVIGKVVGLQLDARAAKSKDRDQDNRKSTALETKSAAGRDHVAEQGTLNKTSNNRTIDAARIASANAGRDARENERDERGRDKQKEQQRDREIAKTVKLRPPQEKDRDRSR